MRSYEVPLEGVAQHYLPFETWSSAICLPARLSNQLLRTAVENIASRENPTSARRNGNDPARANAVEQLDYRKVIASAVVAALETLQYHATGTVHSHGAVLAL